MGEMKNKNWFLVVEGQRHFHQNVSANVTLLTIFFQIDHQNRIAPNNFAKMPFHQISLSVISGWILNPGFVKIHLIIAGLFHGVGG